MDFTGGHRNGDLPMAGKPPDPRSMPFVLGDDAKDIPTSGFLDSEVAGFLKEDDAVVLIEDAAGANTGDKEIDLIHGRSDLLGGGNGSPRSGHREALATGFLDGNGDRKGPGFINDETVKVAVGSVIDDARGVADSDNDAFPTGSLEGNDDDINNGGDRPVNRNMNGSVFGRHEGDDITKQSSENVAISHGDGFKGDAVGDVGIGLSVRVAQAAAVGADIGNVNDHDEARSAAVTGDARGSFKDDVIIGVPKTAVIGDAHTIVGGAAIRDGFHVAGSGSSREVVSREEVAASFW
ncbi:hypothetical protein AMTRI_Chr09g17920 [Amborella trichopoda]